MKLTIYLSEEQEDEIIIKSLKYAAECEGFLSDPLEKKRKSKARWLLKNWYMSLDEWKEYNNG